MDLGNLFDSSSFWYGLAVGGSSTLVGVAIAYFINAINERDISLYPYTTDSKEKRKEWGPSDSRYTSR